ncbi:MAG: hypothetical protein VB086_08565 [Clostridiaceae bacterium]|nr:hypothetical protein [Clostridiaceae bacterium]
MDRLPCASSSEKNQLVASAAEPSKNFSGHAPEGWIICRQTPKSRFNSFYAPAKASYDRTVFFLYAQLVS